MKCEPLITVVLPVYNGEKYLDDAIVSILDQSYKNFELIIVNDGSTDRSGEIIKKYSLIDKRIHVVERVNRGLVHSLNEAIELARGKYIARMDADDVSLTDRFMEQINILESMPEIDVIGCRYELIDACSDLIKEVEVPTEKKDICLALCYTVPFPHASVMIRKSVFEIAKYEEVPTEDYLLWCKLYQSDNFYNIDKVLLRYRYHYGSSLSDTKRLKMIESEKYISKFFFNKNKVLIKSCLLDVSHRNTFFYRAMVKIFLYSDKAFIVRLLAKKPWLIPGFGKYYLRHFARIFVWRSKEKIM